MALSIKDSETDALIRQLAAATGESMTGAVRVAVTERLAKERARAASGVLAAHLDQMIRRGRERTMLDTRTPEEIIGYDGDGLPS